MSRCLFVLLSAFLLVFSFPSFGLWYLAWAALVPLLFALDGQKPIRAFTVSYAAGVLFLFGTVYWLAHVTLLGMIAAVLFFGAYFGFFGLMLSFLFRRVFRYRPLAYTILMPAAWVACEWLRSNLMSGFGWALLGHSQSPNLRFIQIADIFGAYGVSYIVAMVNAAIFLIIKRAISKDKDSLDAVIPFTAILVFLVLAYGQFRMNNIFTGEKLKVAVVQGNIPQEKKWDAAFRDEIMRKYIKLTEDAAKEKVDLIVWPEASVPGYLGSDAGLLEKVQSLAKGVKVELLVGAPRDDRLKKDVYYNSVYHFSRNGEMSGTYDKIHLVPFGEYLPMKKIFSFVENIAPSPIGDFTPGQDYAVFNFFLERRSVGKDYNYKLRKKVKFSALICFEDIFPDISRAFVRHGAVFLVNMTNDAWFKETSAPYQHAQCSVFRAVENRVNVIRAANTGLSCFIDQKGRVSGRVASGRKDIFVDGFSVGEIILTNTRTPYNRYGDLFAYACMALVIAAIPFLARMR